MTTAAAHETRVAPRVGDTRHQAICVTCGRVGPPQQLKGDAEAIAARHHEVGGFER